MALEKIKSIVTLLHTDKTGENFSMGSIVLNANEPLYGEVVKLAQGDYSSYESFYNLSVEYIYKLLLEIVADAEAVNTLVPQLYQDIYATISSLGDASTFFTWAGNMATDKAFNYLLTSRPDRLSQCGNITLNEGISEYAYTDVDKFIPADIMERQELKSILEKRLDALPTISKCILQKYFFHDMSVTEIAAALKLSPLTVKAEISNIKNQLKDVIAYTYGQNYKDNTRVNSLSEMSLVWILFSETLKKVAVPGLAVAGVAGAAAGVAGNVMGAAGAVTGNAGVAGAAGGVAGNAGAAGVAGGVAGNAAGAGGTAGVAGVAGGVAGNAGAAGAVGNGVAAMTVGVGSTGSSVGAVAGGAAAKTGLGLGAKIGIGVACASLATAGVGAFVVIQNNKEKEAEKTSYVAYCEENEIEFLDYYPDGEYVPAEAFAIDRDGNELSQEQVETTVTDSRISIQDVSISYEEDKKVFCFTSASVVDVSIYDPNVMLGAISINVNNCTLYDYYTGTVLPYKFMEGDGLTSAELDVEYSEFNYHLEATQETVWEWGEWDIQGEGHSTRHAVMYTTYVVEMPADYDGLCIAYNSESVDKDSSIDDQEKILDLVDKEKLVTFKIEEARPKNSLNTTEGYAVAQPEATITDSDEGMDNSQSAADTDNPDADAE